MSTLVYGKKILFFGTTAGKTYKVDDSVYTDANTAIALKVRTKNYYLSGPNTIDEIQRLFFYSDEPQGTNISISLDDGVYEYLDSLQDTIQKIDVWEKCYQFSFGLDEISSNNVKIKGFNVHYMPQFEIL